MRDYFYIRQICKYIRNTNCQHASLSSVIARNTFQETNELLHDVEIHHKTNINCNNNKMAMNTNRYAPDESDGRREIAY